MSSTEEGNNESDSLSASERSEVFDYDDMTSSDLAINHKKKRGGEEKKGGANPTKVHTDYDTCTHLTMARSSAPILFQTPGHKRTVRVMSMAHDPKQATKMYTSATFQGACVDSGAEVSVIGADQAQAYQAMMGTPMHMTPSSLQFKFGNYLCQSSGVIDVRVPIPNGSFIAFKAHVVRADIPMLVGLDLLRKHELTLDFSSCTITQQRHNWSLPMTFKAGHVFLEWTKKEICFTAGELQRLHLHFFHPAVDKLFQLIKRAQPEKATGELYATIRRISRSCAACRSYAKKPFRFRASLGPDRIVFNHELAMDLMWLEGNPVLHVIDTHTHFQNATVLRSKRSEDIWAAFVECWASLYVGYPRVIRLDQEASFRATVFDDLATANGIELRFSGTESHNSIGPGERYHGPLRRIFRILRNRYARIEPEVILRYAVKAMNDSMGPEGLVPSLLVFGTIPTFPITESNRPEQAERLAAMAKARDEMAKISAELRIQTALRSRLPPSTRYHLSPGDQVRVYRERSSRWEGPFTITKTREKEVWVTDGNREQHFNRCQVIPDPDDASDKELRRLLSGFENLKSGPPPGILLTEVLHPADPRSKGEHFDEARAKEVCGLLKRKAFKVVCKDEVANDANILGGRFVLAIKNAETEEPLFKARFVVQGHTDAEKNMLVNAATNVKHVSVRLLIAMAAVFGFRVWTQDVAQAYLQSAHALMRKVYVRPTKEFQLNSNELLELLKPLYGLTDAGDYWHVTFAKHLQHDLSMRPTAGDLALYTKTVHDGLACLLGTYVDDTIATGPASFDEDSRLTERKFESKRREYDNVKFAGIEVQKWKEGYHMHQTAYAAKLRELDPQAGFNAFRSLRHQLAWLTHTRPDICSHANILSQVTPASFAKAHIKLINSAVRRGQNGARGLIQHNLDLSTMRMVIFCDSSFANNFDSSTQLGFVILLTDRTRRVNWLHYSSYKSKRIVRSVLGGETYAFADGFDFGFTLRHDLQRITGRKIPITMLTDSQSLFNVIVKASSTTERRLMIDIRATREAYMRGEISDVGWILSTDNIADAFTKLTPCKALDDLMSTGRLDLRVQQWVIRTGSNTKDYTGGIFANPESPTVGRDCKREDNDDQVTSFFPPSRG